MCWLVQELAGLSGAGWCRSSQAYQVLVGVVSRSTCQVLVGVGVIVCVILEVVCERLWLEGISVSGYSRDCGADAGPLVLFLGTRKPR